MTRSQRISARTPEQDRRFDRQNLLVLAGQLIAWGGIISLLHGNYALWIKAPLLIVFCIVMQGVFSFMHDCFHGHGHHNPKINWAIGWLAATIFGTSYTLFQVNHAGHHVRNRTSAELVDFYSPDESVAQKMMFYYTGILGGIWIGGFIASLVLPFLPYKVTRPLAFQKEKNTFSSAFNDFSPKDWNRMRLESFAGVIFWIAVIILFDWQWQVLLVTYAAFAFSWSLLQWVYHVRTPIDVIEGAYNLRAPTPVRWAFLNFNYNLTHHRHPGYRWQELYDVSDQRETQPLGYRLLRMIFPPQPLPDDPSTIRKDYF